MSRERAGGRTAGLLIWIALGLTVVAAIVLVSLKKPPPAVSEIEEKAVTVRTHTVQPQTVPDLLLVPGRIEAKADVTVSAETAGTIVSLMVERGDEVSEGQELLTLDSALWRALAKRAEIEVREAEKEFSRWERLKETGAVSDSEYDSIATRLDMGRAALTEAEVNLAKCRMVAPLSGRVEERFIEQGEYVTEGQAAFRIVDTTSLKVVSEVPERDIAAVSKGQELSFSVSSLKTLTTTGRVSFVSESGRRESNCFPVEVLVEEPPDGLRPGMIAELTVVRQVWKDVVVVPLSAVVPRKGDHVVFVTHESDGETRTRSKLIRIERILGDSALIADGLHVGDELVVEGQRTLQDGQLVEVITD